MNQEDLMRLRMQCLSLSEGNIDHAKKLVEYVADETVTPTLRVYDMSFGDAIYHMKNGIAVAREGWNGKGMFLYLVPANSYPSQTGIAKEFWGEKAKVLYGAYIAMKTAQDNVVPWLASQTDVLAEDWMVVYPSQNKKEV